MSDDKVVPFKPRLVAVTSTAEVPEVAVNPVLEQAAAAAYAAYCGATAEQFAKATGMTYVPWDRLPEEGREPWRIAATAVLPNLMPNQPAKFFNQTFVKLRESEPFFVLRAQDMYAPNVVEYWARLAEDNGVDKAKVAAARDVAKSMRQFDGRRKPD